MPIYSSPPTRNPLWDREQSRTTSRPQIRPTSYDVRAGGRGGGMSVPNWLPPTPSPTSNQGVVPSQSSNLYSQTAGQQAGDYRNLFSRYENLLNQPGSTYTDYSPERLTYTESPEAQTSLNQLSELARTGGLGEEEQANLRARGISPIRSVYANALRNLNRRRNIAGGYAPGLAASTARMAREQGELAAGATTNVNAEIAEQIRQGRLAAAPTYERATADRTAAINRIAEQNAAARQQAEEFNRTQSLATEESNRNRFLEGMRGMTSLYGTTPGLTETFGRQVLGEQGQEQQQGETLINAYLRSIGR